MRGLNKLINKFRQYGFRTAVKFSILELRRLVWQYLLNSYSQNKEDLFLDKILNKKRGFYVDVGAYDPFRYSNTARFYKKGGSGINIEPNPARFARFVKFRERDINLNCGVGSTTTKKLFYFFENDLLNTFSSFEAKRYIKLGFKLENKQKLEVVRLSEVFSKYLKDRKIDFLNIDTEGMQLEVLKSNDWQRFKPKVICIETYYSYLQPTAEAESISKFLEKMGYTKYCDVGQNSIFVDRKFPAG